MFFLIFCVSIIYLVPCSAKITYFNLETTYGPFCNAQHVYKPDAGIVRYAGTPWTGNCELRLESPAPRSMLNLSSTSNGTLWTRFYIYLQKPPLCVSENVTIETETGEKLTIDCHTANGSEYFLDAEKLTINFYRAEKFPLSKFSMIVTPMKRKTRILSACGFDCFTDTYCIARSLVCDRYRNCPNHVDEAHCGYHTQRKPLSFRLKVILMIILSSMIAFDVSSILICYFCCGISNRHRLSFVRKSRRSVRKTPSLEEGLGATLLDESKTLKNNDQSH